LSFQLVIIDVKILFFF